MGIVDANHVEEEGRGTEGGEALWKRDLIGFPTLKCPPLRTDNFGLVEGGACVSDCGSAVVVVLCGSRLVILELENGYGDGKAESDF